MIDKFQFLLILLSSIFLLGCNSSQLYIVQGTVKDGLTGEPLKNAEIIIDYSKLENGAYSNAFVTAATTSSDDEGNYTIEFEAEKVVEFRLRSDVNDYFERIDTLSRESWSQKGSNEYNIALYRNSNIDFHFIGRKTGVTFLYKLNTNSPGCRDCCSEQNMVFSGLVDTSFSCSVFGNQTIDFEATRISGSQTSEITGSIDVYESTQSFEYEIQ